MKRALLASLGCLLLPALAATAAAATPREWDFTVFLDKREIGTHRFTVSDAGEGQEIAIQANFTVKIAGITFYRYAHSNKESWKGACLQAIAAKTDDDGKPFQVDGQASGDTFTVKTLKDTRTLEGCISTYAYWDKALVTRRMALNSQTGEYQALSVTSLGAGKAQHGTRSVDVERFRITAPKLDITLGYAADGEWMSLESTVDGGKLLRYVRK